MSSKNKDFRTKRLFLKKVQPIDQKDIFRGLSHPEVIKHYGVSYTSIEDTREQMNWYSNLEKAGSGMWWSIRVEENSHFCGAIGYNDLQEENRKAEIGFWLLPEFRGNGFIIEAAEVLLEYLFKDLNLHRVEAFIESQNHNSSKVLKKLGFTCEGNMRDYEFKNGEYVDVEIYAKINSDS